MARSWAADAEYAKDGRRRRGGAGARPVADFTAAIVRLLKRRVLVMSLYISGGDSQALLDEFDKLEEVITDVRRRVGIVVDVMLAVDSNQHDQLWERRI